MSCVYNARTSDHVCACHPILPSSQQYLAAGSDIIGRYTPVM